MSERDYVLGTEDDEVERLGIQHGVWRARVLDAFARAGIRSGDTVLDIGAGPGFVSTDLAGIVGPTGRVIAVERSRRFLAALSRRAVTLGLSNIETREQDVADGFGDAVADASWCRWLLAFAPQPRKVVGDVARALRPSGIAIYHEYADYGSWRTMPPSADLDRFRDLVVRSWRDAGGEPDIALPLPHWLVEEGLEIVETRALIDVVDRSDPIWQWPASFIASGADRLSELGYLDGAEATRLSTMLERLPPDARMITPLVVEVIARRPA